MNTTKSNHWTELHTAAKNGDTETLSRLIRNGANINAVTQLGWTPLHFTAWYGYLDCCRILIEAGAAMNTSTNLRFWTPCHLAALEGHTEIVRLFLENDFDLNTRTSEGWTPLHAAVEHAHRETVLFLLERGDDPNLAKRPEMATFPLHSAARNGRMDIVRLLVEHGAEVNVCNKQGKTPRDFATDSGFPLLVEFFDETSRPKIGSSAITFDVIRERIRRGDLEWIKQWKESGAPCSSNRYSTPLFEASVAGQTAIVKYLLESGEKPNQGGPWSPLYFLLLFKSFEKNDVIRLLLEYGADPTVRDFEGLTVSERWEKEIPAVPLELLELLESHGLRLEPAKKKIAALRWAVETHNHPQAEALLVDGADPNYTYRFDMKIPLRVAIEKSDTEMVRLLLKHGANPNKKGTLEEPRFYEAASGGNLEIVKMLVEAGAIVNRKADFGSPLHVALQKGHTAVVDFLLEQGADVESRKKRVCGHRVDVSSTPIFAALQSKDSKLIQKMIDQGVDITQIGDYGNTLLHAAVESGLIQWVRYFLDHGLKIDAMNRFQHRPLDIAITRRHREIANLLMERGASVLPPQTYSPVVYDIMLHRNDLLEDALKRDRAEAGRPSQAHNSAIWNQTPLVIALEYENFDAVELLLKYGASITGAQITTHQEGAWGDSALTYVCRKGMKTLLERFLREKININSKSAVYPPLHCAANTEIVQILLKHGANPYLRSNSHRTALECQLQNKEVADLLREVMSREPMP